MRRIKSWLFWPVLIGMTVFILFPLSIAYLNSLILDVLSRVNLGFSRSVLVDKIIGKLIKANTKLVSKTNWIWGRATLYFAGVRIKGIEGIQFAMGGPFVVVTNHSSILDIAACLTILKDLDFRFGSDPKYFKYPLLGWDMKLGGHFKIDRENPRKGARDLLEKGGDALQRGQSVVIFPEGTRSRDGTIGQFYKLSFKLAIEQQVPVLVMTLHGLREAISPGGKQPRPVDLYACIEPPINTDKMGRGDVGSLTEHSRSLVLSAIARLSNAH